MATDGSNALSPALANICAAAGFTCNSFTANNPYNSAYTPTFTPYSGARPLSNNALRAFSGTLTMSNLVPHGMLQEAGAGVFSIGPWLNSTSLDAGLCYLGINGPSDLAANYDGLGGVALCSVANGWSPITSQAGTFTATTFTPTTPFPPGVLPSRDVIIVTNDTPLPYIGWMSSYATNGLGQVTSVTVTDWYQVGNLSGGTGVAGTPSGSVAMFNYATKVWTRNTVTRLPYLNGISGNTHSTKTIDGIAGTDVAFLSPYEPISGSGIPTGAKIMTVNAAHTSITIDPPATTTGTGVSLTVGSQPFNRAVADEVDIENSNSIAFNPGIYTVSGTATAGSQEITSYSASSINPGTIYPGLVCSGTNFGLSTIMSIDRTNSNLYFDVKTGTSGTVNLICFDRFDTAVGGIDVVGEGNTGPAFVARGNPIYGYLGSGAVDSSFLSMPQRAGSSDAIPKYGFRSDQTVQNALVADFAITQQMPNAQTFWAASAAGETWNLNASGLGLPASAAGTIVQLGNADSTNSIIDVDGFGGSSFLMLRHAEGTLATPTATSQTIGSLQWGGYDATNRWSGPQGAVGGVPDVTWTSTSHPLDIYFQTTPAGSRTLATNIVINNDGSFRSVGGGSGTPTATAGATNCGTSPSVSGTPVTGTVTIGSGTVGTACPVAFASAIAARPHCVLNDQTTAALVRATSESTTGFTIKGSYAAGDAVDYICLTN